MISRVPLKHPGFLSTIVITIVWLLPLFVQNRYGLLSAGSLITGGALFASLHLGLPRWPFLCLFSGILITASMPGYGIRPLAFVAMIPLLRVLTQSPSWRRAVAGSLITGITLILYAMGWCSRAFVNYSNVSPLIGYLLFLPVALTLSYKIILLGFLFWVNERKRFLPGALFAAATIAALETTSLDLYPWYIGLTQCGGDLAQLADLGGLPLVSFVVVLVNVLLLDSLKHCMRRQLNSAVVPMALIVVVLTLSTVYSWYRMVRLIALGSEAPTFNVAIVQPNTPRKVLKADTALRDEICSTLLTLSREAAGTLKPDLIVFGEGSAPMGYQVRFHPEFCDTYAQIARELQVPLMTDNIHIVRGEGGRPRMWRGAILIAPDGSVKGEYLKRKLVMFGEYLPLEGIFPILRKLFPFGMSYESGNKWPLLSAGGVQLAPQICFEGIHPELSRAYVSTGAKLIINLVNDVWYDSQLQTEQHLALSAMRCIENRRSMVRATNTGISAYIDPAGHIIADASSANTKWSDCRRVRLYNITSPFTRVGNLFGWLCLTIVAGAILYRFQASRRTQPPG